MTKLTDINYSKVRHLLWAAVITITIGAFNRAMVNTQEICFQLVLGMCSSIWNHIRPFVRYMYGNVDGSLLAKLHLQRVIWSKLVCLVVWTFWIWWLNWNVQLNDGGSLLLVKSSINKVVWYSYKSFSFRIPDRLNNGSVWLLNPNLLMVRIARFCSLTVLFILTRLVFPQTSIL